ncbi:glycoside hydrolase family 2 TIM barrel-domain containing protein [Opitutus sp. ER46]|uniref:glycoside hydrolase family 2 TIM barrel-domain containing protein n=1 Tax=Opitutus sp. ER46 TaxID=2161864 RepID=UPI000D31F20D|nr:glycoside hydrolase family 2 TIM barrel-domain containing protein [Opitutus sp. ER46]PTX91083.1 beta-galactosidase [Opitutus sp. ER46]
MLAASAALISAAARGASEPITQRQYLSGRGPKDAVTWEFTVTGGRRAGEKATIPVPSNWELHGFGSYHYGQQKVKSDEHGLYRTRFQLPAEWEGRRLWLVFDGVMTDAVVTVNGRQAGPIHQGGFNRFRFEVTPLVRFGAGGENVLEVDVAKVSANEDTEKAERGGDYWVFGGIYRPVWIESAPTQWIDHVAVDAQADGAINMDVTLGAVRDADRVEAEIVDGAGRVAGPLLSTRIPAGGAGRVRVTGQVPAVQPWSAESPVLYTLRLALRRGVEVVHTLEQRFGFRTFEVREGDGLYVNGQRVRLKGVNRHSFRPATGRALNPEDCYADVRLIREMNMNAVRMSHYPPDEAFLNACDELGLYVLDELSGWQKAHGTAVGRLLVRSLVERDVNHPSILFWDNGNEGGWNRDLDGEFALYDPQRRPVLHPWELHAGVNTKHYPNFDVLEGLLRGRDLVMPTEVLHAMYDGGAGAGLEDYWNAIVASPVGAGAFIWVFADEGVVRTDRGGKIDVFSTFAPDGIVGPNHEKEGSFFAVREIWSPVQIDAPRLDAGFDGTLTVKNRYDFTSLKQCRFAWELRRFDLKAPSATTAQVVVARGEMPGPDVAPQSRGQMRLALPASWAEADALAVTAFSPRGDALWTWTWATPRLSERGKTLAGSMAAVQPAAEPASVTKHDDMIELKAAGVTARFDARTGMLRDVRRGGKTFPLSQGPRLVFARQANGTEPTWLPFTEVDRTLAEGTHRLAQPGLASCVEIELVELRGADAVLGATIEVSADGEHWETIFDATRRPQDGARFEFAPQLVAAVRLSNLRRYDPRPVTLRTFRVGYSAERFPVSVTQPAVVTTGEGVEPGSAGAVAWLEAAGGPSGMGRVRWTIRSDGTLRLDYSYNVNGRFSFHGVTFDCPENELAGFRWLGRGPHRVWQNRLKGTTLGVHEHRPHVVQPGESWEYPEFEGYFAEPYWTQFATAAGAMAVSTSSGDVYLRVGTPRISAATTTADFPPGEISLLHAIPAIGSKGKPPERAGPQSQYAIGAGRYEGTCIFQFGEN